MQLSRIPARMSEGYRRFGLPLSGTLVSHGNSGFNARAI